MKMASAFINLQMANSIVWVARPEVLRRACSLCKGITPFGVPQGVPPPQMAFAV